MNAARFFSSTAFCSALIGAPTILSTVSPPSSLLDVLEAFVQLANLIIGKRPIAGTAGEPELDVAELLQRHDLAEPRHVPDGAGASSALAANPAVSNTDAINAANPGFMKFSSVGGRPDKTNSRPPEMPPPSQLIGASFSLHAFGYACSQA